MKIKYEAVHPVDALKVMFPDLDPDVEASMREICDVTVNVRQRMVLVADWLGWQDENLSFGLRTLQDAERLYLMANYAGPPYTEMADEWPEGLIKRVIGYDPFAEACRKSELLLLKSSG